MDHAADDGIGRPGLRLGLAAGAGDFRCAVRVGVPVTGPAAMGRPALPCRSGVRAVMRSRATAERGSGVVPAGLGQDGVDGGGRCGGGESWYLSAIPSRSSEACLKAACT